MRILLDAFGTSLPSVVVIMVVILGEMLNPQTESHYLLVWLLRFRTLIELVEIFLVSFGNKKEIVCPAKKRRWLGLRLSVSGDGEFRDRFSGLQAFVGEYQRSGPVKEKK